MNTRTTRLLAVLVACALVVTAGGPAVAMAGASQGSTDGFETAVDRPAPETATIDDRLERETGETTVVIRLAGADERALQGDRGTVVDALRTHADRTQAPVLDRLEAMDGVVVEETWWIANAIMVTADLDRVSLADLAAIDGVERLHANHRFAPPEPVTATAADPAAENVTYGLEQINATAAWEAFDATGDGVRVTVVDTGVDADHPDIELAEEDGWIDFVGESAEPVDDHGHGTHVSGTISGGNASGTAIGVAPDVELANARVCDADGGCDGVAILDAMQWAVDTDSDVISMSLGGPITGAYVEPVRNAMGSGTLVVASIGNSGEGTAGSPGAVYDSIASGATDENESVTGFSGGMLIDTDATFGDAAPDDWPDEYITPDIAAPGFEVFSANAYGGTMCGEVEYCEVSGTSMSAPHKSGAAAAIIEAAGGELDPYELQDLMKQAAWKPDDWDEEEAQDAIHGADTRYGHGIIDVYTTARFATTDAAIAGTVTDADGDPVEGATVAVDGEIAAVTDADGAYHLRELPGTYDLTVEAFGYETAERTVTIEDDDHVAEANFSLVDVLDATVLADQADRIEGGESVSVTLEVANLESIAVDLVGDYDAADADLSIDGEDVAFGEPIEFDEPVDGHLTVTVETDADTSGEFVLEHALAGLGDDLSIETGPTMVFEELARVAVLDDDDIHGHDVAETLLETLPMDYAVDVVDSTDAPGDYDVIVVQRIDPAEAASFVEATAGADVRVVYLDQWGEESNGIPAHANVTGDPAETFEDDFGGQPVYYELTGDHEIFDGVGEAGDTVDVHTGTFADLTWFEGTSFDVYADIGDQEGISGTAFAVDEGSATIFASGLGYTQFVGADEYTDDADAILANSVEYLYEYEPPEAEATIDLEDVAVTPGGSVDVALSVPDAAVAGYEAKIEFDPSVVQVADVTGVDFDTPVTEVDNEAGTLSLAQAQAVDVEAPTLASIEFEHVGEAGDETTLAFDDANTALNDADGPLVTGTDDGSITTHPCEPGDVNADGDVTPFDATLTQQYIVGLEPADDFYPVCADLDGSGSVTPADVTLILELIVGGHGLDAIAG